MIKTYQEEVNSRRNKAAIFWFFVFLSSVFLYMFFQWYYIKIDFQLDSNNSKTPQPIIKQFGIINLRTQPNPDNIFINWVSYSNWDKKINDYGKYGVEIYKKWYIPAIFDIIINKDYPIFYDIINIFKIWEYSKIDIKFDEISKVDGYYFLKNKNDKTIWVYSLDFKPLKIFFTDLSYIWYKYFSDNWKIYTYDYELNYLKELIDQKTNLEINCKNSRVLHGRLFCFDIMDFIDGSSMEEWQTVLRINNNIILTNEYIFNNWNWWDWWSYEKTNDIIFDPDNLVHIDNMPFILEDWYLYSLQDNKKKKFEINEIDIIKKWFEFWKETMLIGYKNDELIFVLFNEKRKYVWSLAKTDANEVEIIKHKWAYLINTSKNLYLYYKWAKQLYSILSWEDILIFDNIINFKKDSNNYFLNINQ